jgi:hypothetical protein
MPDVQWHVAGKIDGAKVLTVRGVGGARVNTPAIKAHYHSKRQQQADDVGTRSSVC